MAVLRAYERLIQSGQLVRDPRQLAALTHLDQLLESIHQPPPPPPWWARVLSPRPAPAPALLPGVYLHGGVGCGKTMLLDLFHQVVQDVAISSRRTHFHSFMLDVHARLHALRQHKLPNPLAVVAADIASTHRVLCFDEMLVMDVADAMILRHLFEALFAHECCFVATSNARPADLYKNGINREVFVPFIKLLETRCKIHNMDSERDYRKEALKDLGFGLFTNIAPGTLNAQQALNQALEFFFKSVPTTEAMYLRVLGRDFPIRRSWKGSVCAFGFSELFETPSSTAEYLAVAEAFDCIVIDQLKPFSASAESSCRRFTNALDVWYDQKKRIICLSSSPVEQLFSALEKSTGTSAADPRFSMKVTNEGGSTSSQTTFIQDPLRKDPMEWSATGRKEASLAALFKSKHDEALLLRRAVSRLKEIERRGDFLIVKT